MTRRPGHPPRSRRSLRTRLLVAFVVPLVVVLALVGVVSVTALRAQLVSQVDTRLDAATQRSENYSPQPGYGQPPGQPDDDDDDDDHGGPGFLGARGQGEGTLGATVVDGLCTDAGVLGPGGQTLELTSAQEAVLGRLPTDGHPVTRDLGGDLGDYRLVANVVPSGDVLVTGLPLTGTADAVRRLVAVELLVGVLALAAAALTAVLVIRRTLHPLDRVAATATGSRSCRWPAARSGWPSACRRRTPIPGPRSARSERR